MTTRAVSGVLPGFAGTAAYAGLYLGAIVLFPLAVMVVKASGLGLPGLWAAATEPRALAALRVSFVSSLLAALIDGFFGLIIAFVLTRYSFPGRRLVDALVDLPFALPTAVAGISLATLYGPHGWLGAPLAAMGISVAYTPLGILVALIFVGLPFVVRTIQPVLAEFERELEEASATLGASSFHTLRRVLLPPLLPPLITGMTLAFARAVGEYGSVVFIAGNRRFVSEIAPLLIIVKLEQFDYTGATGIATIMLIISFAALLLINLLQSFSRKRLGYV